MRHPKYKLRLNIKSIMLYEQLTKQSFLRFEENTFENSVPLIYCMLCANNEDFKVTYQDAVSLIFTDEKLVSEMMEKLQAELAFNNQFQGYNFLFDEDRETEDTTEEKQPQKEEKKQRLIYVSELVPALVKECGLSIEYVLNDMPLNNDVLFLHYRDELRKTEMENKRLFTYVTISPHINTKKMPYSKFMRFEWEKERKVKNAKQYLSDEENIRKMQEFLKSAPLEKPLTEE